MEDVKQIEETAVAIPDKARTLVVNDGESLKTASAFLLTIKALRRKIADTFDPIIKKAHEAHKEAIAQKKNVETPLLEGEKIVKGAIGVYSDEQDRIRREAEAKQRREQEAFELKKREEEERALAAAIEAEEAGKPEAAAEIVAEAETIADKLPETVTLPPPKPMMSHGVSTRKVWKFEVVDATQVPRSYLVPDEKKIGNALKAADYDIDIPGVRTWQETSVASR